MDVMQSYFNYRRKVTDRKLSFFYYLYNASKKIICQYANLSCMKKNIPLLTLQLLTAALIILMTSGCSKNANNKKAKTYTYTIYSDPVYKSRADVLASINGAAFTSVTHAGKLYIKDNFIYLNEVNKGIHIIDNSNASHPVQIAFLSIPGNLDIAIKGNILYADMYNDLLALDITDPHHVKITGTIKDFFTDREYVNGFVANNNDEIVVDWDEKDTTININDQLYNGCDRCELVLSSNAPNASSKPGTAGSMASMVLVNNFLYAISEMHSLGIVDVSNAASPKLDSSFFAGFDLETIYPFENKLFLGSSEGVFMYDIGDPEHPASIGEFTHGTACDPVIADGNYAYVTLHSGTECGGAANELDVVNVQDVANSKLVKTYNLTKPEGLSKDGDLLFVCDDANVKIYNAANASGLRLLQQIKSNEPYDVIAADKKLIVVAADGLYQYDYSNMNNIHLLSFITAKK